jgi:hypothetical protein
VVGVGDNGIALAQVSLLDLLGCHLAVGYGGVTMKIGLVELTVLGQQIPFHDFSSRLLSLELL